MASIRIEITGNTGNSVQELNNVATAVENVGEQEKKVAKTEEEKWLEARQRNERKKKWLEEQKKLEEEAANATKQNATDTRGLYEKLDNYVKKVHGGWTSLKSKIDLFSGAFGKVSGFVNDLKDDIIAFEEVVTQKKVIKLLSEDGEDLNEVLSRTMEITSGMVGNNELLSTVNSLLNKEFKLSKQSLEGLIDVSASYSKVTGEDVASTIEKIAEASQEEKQEMLAKMGAYIDIEDELEKYASSIDRSVNSLSQQERMNQTIIVTTQHLKQKFDELGLSAKALENPITTTFKRADESINLVKETAVRYLSEFYVDAIDSFEDLFAWYSEFSERLEAFIQDGFEGRDRVAKKYADKRYAEQQVEIKKEIELNEKANIMKTDAFIKYAEQQKAYGIENVEVIYASYKLLLSKLEKEQGKTFLINYKLFNIDPSKDKRNLAKEMFFTSEEVDTGFKVLDDKFKTFNDEYKKVVEEIKKIREKIAEDQIEDEVEREQMKYDKLFDELLAFQNANVKHTKKYYADLDLLRAKAEAQGIVLNEARAKQEEEYFGEDGLLNKIQKEGATKDKEDNKISNEEKLAILMENNAIKYDLILAQRDLENTVQMDLIKSEEKALQRRLEIAKSYTKDATDLIFTSLTDKRVALDNEIADNKEAYKKGYITEEEYIKKKDELNKKSSKFRENLVKEVAANAMKRAGSEIFNDGLTGLWQGGRWALSPWPSMQAQGVATISYSLAEMGAGLALGYAGAKIMPRTGVTGSKDEASKDKNETMKDNKQDYKVNTYLFPNERQWLQQLQTSQTRLNG